MLKDVGDSKRLDAYVHKESDKRTLQQQEVPPWLKSKILSGAFWPQLRYANFLRSLLPR